MSVIATEHDGGRFALTPLGDALKSDAPGAVRDTILTMAGQLIWSVLFDRPHVVTEAQALLRTWNAEDRVTIEHGSFFERVPAGVLRTSCRTSSTTGTRISV